MLCVCKIEVEDVKIFRFLLLVVSGIVVVKLQSCKVRLFLTVVITEVCTTEGWSEVQRPAVCREAAADHLHDVLGCHQLGRHRALAL